MYFTRLIEKLTKFFFNEKKSDKNYIITNDVKTLKDLEQWYLSNKKGFFFD